MHNDTVDNWNIYRMLLRNFNPRRISRSLLIETAEKVKIKSYELSSKCFEYIVSKIRVSFYQMYLVKRNENRMPKSEISF